MKPINLLVGGLTLFTAQGCKAPKQVVEQSEHPNIIYVFPDQYSNQAMGFWRSRTYPQSGCICAGVYGSDLRAKQLSVE